MSVTRLPPALDLIRAHPDMYLPRGNLPLWNKLQGLLVFDAITLGAEAVTTRRMGMWTLVESNTDWLYLGHYRKTSLTDLFGNVLPFVEAGDNSIRHEVVVAAFASCVVTSGPEGMTTIQWSGDVAAEEGSRVVAGSTATRIVAFM